jgi:hypothetical protein
MLDELVILGVCNGVFAYLFSNALTAPGMVFGWWWRVVRVRPGSAAYNALGGCSKCFAGQLTLWMGIAWCLFLSPAWLALYPALVAAMFTAFILENYIR